MSEREQEEHRAEAESLQQYIDLESYDVVPGRLHRELEAEVERLRGENAELSLSLAAALGNAALAPPEKPEEGE